MSGPRNRGEFPTNYKKYIYNLPAGSQIYLKFVYSLFTIIYIIDSHQLHEFVVHKLDTFATMRHVCVMLGISKYTYPKTLVASTAPCKHEDINP